MLNDSVLAYGFGITSNSDGGVIPTADGCAPGNPLAPKRIFWASVRVLLQIVERRRSSGNVAASSAEASRSSCVNCSYSWSMSMISTS